MGTRATTTYDANGRVSESFDPLGNKTINGYTTDSTTGLVVQTTVTNALDHVITSTIEPAWGTAVKTTDPNNVATETTYDGLGRLTNVWLPGRNKATQSASLKFTYLDLAGELTFDVRFG